MYNIIFQMHFLYILYYFLHNIYFLHHLLYFLIIQKCKKNKCSGPKPNNERSVILCNVLYAFGQVEYAKISCSMLECLADSTMHV